MIGATSKRMQFPVEIKKGGLVKKKGLGDNVQGRVSMQGAKGNVSVEVAVIYLNEDFLRRIDVGDELEIELIIRKK